MVQDHQLSWHGLPERILSRGVKGAMVAAVARGPIRDSGSIKFRTSAKLAPVWPEALDQNGQYFCVPPVQPRLL